MMSPTDPDYPLAFALAAAILGIVGALLWRLGKPPERRVKYWQNQHRKPPATK